MSAPPATHWLIVAYDTPAGPRAQYRDEHLSRSKPLHDEGLLRTSGVRSICRISPRMPTKIHFSFELLDMIGFESARCSRHVEVGGPMLSDDATTMIGSTLIIKADGKFKTLDDLWNFVRSDTYYVNGVWDKSRISVHPFFPGGGVTFGRSS